MWPPSVNAGAVLSFDFDADEVWLAEDPDNARRPGVLSQGVYGAKVGVPLILGLLEQTGLRATFFVPGAVAARYPDRVREILAGGHEVALHGYTHRSPATLTAAEEEDELLRSLETLRALGADPAGYRSPSWDFSERTLALLAREGILYSSNMMDDVRPYRHEGSPLIELPVQWMLDDAPHFWFDSASSWNKTISTPSAVSEIWTKELEGIRLMGGLFVLTMHPQLIGRPSRLAMLRELIDTMRSRHDLWIATALEVAERADAALGRSDDD
jgi:peptidoglycan/xylan/chitin deacetylase (PgdA/CDA1 family)